MKAEEIKELKDKLKKQIAELSDEELDKVAGGAESVDPRDMAILKCDRCGAEYISYKSDIGKQHSAISNVYHVDYLCDGIIRFKEELFSEEELDIFFK